MTLDPAAMAAQVAEARRLLLAAPDPALALRAALAEPAP